MAESCDRCTAKAYVFLVLVTVPGMYLQLCAHHYSVHHPALSAKGWGVMTDNRKELTP